MQGKLLVAVLTVRGSYLRELEEPALPGEPPDTLQWWISASGCWRIRTYALDHDIHTHSVSGGVEEIENLARANTEKHYGDVLAALHAIDIADATATDATAAALAASDLGPNFDVAAGRFMFWRPDDARYRSQSDPG